METTAISNQRVFAFGKDKAGANVTEGNRTMKAVLGGKGANLAEMAMIGLPVPPGFTISCQTCVEYSNNNNAFPAGAWDEILKYKTDLESRIGKTIGDNDDPLLVSVRSGAPFSMPGMMDTVLNLGLNDKSVLGLIKQTNNERFCWDSYRRFIQMFSKVVMDVDGDLFEEAIAKVRNSEGVKDDSNISAAGLQGLVSEFKSIFTNNIDSAQYPNLVGAGGEVEFPQDPTVQLELAIRAVFGSWMNDRAILYRKQNKISDDLGTAVNVQAMVFGNKGNTSATGVAFTRDPAAGDKVFYGDFLVNAQGEDVVAGIRNTSPIAELKDIPELAEAGKELEEVFIILENHYRDMCDIEFTIEAGKLWMLQTRVGKRTAAASVKIAIDMQGEGLITKEEAILRVDPSSLDKLMHPRFDKTAQYDVVAQGMNASPGAAVGAAVFSAETAVEYAKQNKPCVLLRWETNPDDLAGMTAAEGILTSHGGKTSHAAVIARGMGKPCVCGADALNIDAKTQSATITGTDIVINEGDFISIDGTSGSVVLGQVDLVEPELTGDFDTILKWADDARKLGVRANADNPEDAQLARDFGASGIGLCRTEHMFLGERKQIIQNYILTEDDSVKKAAIDSLLSAQRGDFYGMLQAMDGLPVVIRLLDPPLHEFLDSPRELEVEIVRAQSSGETVIGGENSTYTGEAVGKTIAQAKQLLEQIDSFAESNPMLGLRGVRLAIQYPELPYLQAKAIAEATAKLIKDGFKPHPEIMIPLVSIKTELDIMRTEVQAVIDQVAQETGVELNIPIGTMIELPRAAMTADQIAQSADFFSFGTNDLTQTAFGFSRDDAEGKFIPNYLDRKILKINPFETIDSGVAKLVAHAVDQGRIHNPLISLGVCGEHGGDPDSIMTFAQIGLDYVSCSPYRVPVARLAAAHAALQESHAASDNR